jgi:hypothetical protein
MTVGAVMKERGIVQDNADPHAELGQKIPRAVFLKETVLNLLKTLDLPRELGSKLKAKFEEPKL